MLELRPSCEHCNRPLPPADPDAMICSFECTFCKECVDLVLHNVCPNCGGGFVRRPIRPALDHRNGNCLVHHPASTRVIYKPVDPQVHETFSVQLREVAPEKR